MTTSHQHLHDLRHSALRLPLLGIVLNILLAAIKGITGVLGNSYALIADALESVLDVGQSLVVWGGLRIATTPPDDNHPYGHGKAEPIAATVVAMGLVAGAVGLAIQALREIRTPQQTPAPYTLVVLILVVIAKELLYRYFKYKGTEVQSSAIIADAWHQRSDALTSGAAFIGISIAVFGGEAYASADEWAALFACSIIAYNGIRLLRPALAEIMDVAPPKEFVQSIRTVAGDVVGVQDLDVCYVRKMGLDFFVDIHVGVDGGMPVRDGHAIAHRVKDAIREAHPQVRDVMVHIEPVEPN
jgi:cation diffusion facilitator family transporter